jgi:tRNA modification GTPase
LECDVTECGKTVVCVLTGRQMAAIGSVALAGAGAGAMLQKVFRLANGQPASAERFGTGAVLHGTLREGDLTLDEVVVGCEAEDYFVVHGHGNPLLTERMVRLFETQGAVLMEAEEFLFERYRRESQTLIEAEAKLWMQKAATLSGVKIVSSQLTEGLLPTVRRWLDGFDEMTLEQLWAQCHQVLRKSSRAEYLLRRCRIVLVGPPNSGKSTLLNRLAGREEAIVSDTAGTTRDWVSITCRVGPLLAEIYDTAGLSVKLMREDEVEQAAQRTAMELVRSADMNIFVYDAARIQQAQWLLFSIGSMKGVIVANKCDRLAPGQQDLLYSKYVPISAKTGEGIDRLIHTMTAALKVDDFDCTAPVCFTDRQLAILRQLIHTKEKPQAKKLIETLSFGNIPV